MINEITNKGYKESRMEINYVIINIPRTGSTLFFDILKNNLMTIHNPDNIWYEPFHDMLLENIEYKDINIEKFIHEQFEKYSIIYQGIKIRGFKISIDNIEKFLKNYNTINNVKVTVDIFLNLLPENTKCIFFVRKNILRQAVSLYKAEYSNQWFQEVYQKKIYSVPFSFLRIYSCLQYIKITQEKTSNILNRLSIPYITFEYESYTKDLESSMRQFFLYIGIAKESVIDQVNLKIQRNFNSEILYLKFCILYKFFISAKYIRSRARKFLNNIL